MNTTIYPTQEELEAMRPEPRGQILINLETCKYFGNAWSAYELDQYARRIIDWHIAKLNKRVPVAFLDIEKVSKGMAYATRFRANERQVPLHAAPVPAQSDDAKDAALKLALNNFDRIRSLAATIGNDRIFDKATESMDAIDAAMKGGE